MRSSSSPMRPAARARARRRAVVQIHLGTMRPNDWKPVSEDLVKDAIELLVNPETRPVIIMCS